MDRSGRFAVAGQNRLLAALPRGLQIQLLSRMEKLSLPLRHVLHEPGSPITHVYFPLSGVVSLVMLMKDGEAAEVATSGNEGVVGTPVFLGAEASPWKAVTQVEGQALRMRSDDFRQAVEEHQELAGMVRRYVQCLFNQVALTTACNHVHSVQQRMCRWLLATHDRAGADEFHLTQEFLAQMLGVRRPSVTIAAGHLQKAGLIRYRRGRIGIASRAGLEAGACECYDTSRQDFDRLLAPPP